MLFEEGERPCNNKSLPLQMWECILEQSRNIVFQELSIGDVWIADC